MTMKCKTYRSVLMVLVLLLGACHSYKQVPTSLNGIDNEENYVILHQKQKQWFMYDAQVTADSVSGTICSMIDHSLEARFVHVYVTGAYEVPQGDHEPVAIPAEVIISVEVNQRDAKKSFLKTSGIIGFFLLAGVVIPVIISR